MNAASKPLRAAASVLVLAQDASSIRQTYKVLFVKRSSKAAFMPSRYVFPGGVLDPPDTLSHWKLTETEGHSIVTKHPISSFRVTALRELFEETGILLARENKDASDGDRCKCFPVANTNRERKDVHRDAGLFWPFCQRLGVKLDTAPLRHWSNWITPIQEKRRFDTHFFIAPLRVSEPPQATPDDGESVTATWLSPSEALKASAENKIILAPPTVYMLRELEACGTSMEDVLSSWQRRRWPLPIQPQIRQGEQGEIVIAMPGDKDYTWPSEELKAAYDGVSLQHGLHRVTMQDRGVWRVESPALPVSRL